MRQRISLLILFACVAFSCVGIGFVALGLRPDDFRPGIGEPEQAKIKIQRGMTKDEVRAVLGRPHWPRDREGDRPGDYWTYRCDFFGGTLFRVYFGTDDVVKHREWWLD